MPQEIRPGHHNKNNPILFIAFLTNEDNAFKSACFIDFRTKSTFTLYIDQLMFYCGYYFRQENVIWTVYSLWLR